MPWRRKMSPTWVMSVPSTGTSVPIVGIWIIGIGADEGGIESECVHSESVKLLYVKRPDQSFWRVVMLSSLSLVHRFLYLVVL